MAEKYNSDKKGYWLTRYHQRRLEGINLLGGKCVQCGSEKDLEFDHIYPERKSFELARLWSVSKEKYFEEVKKCQLLCRICHKIKSDKEKTTRVHGTPAMYKRGKCRCEPCTTSNSAYIQGFKVKRRLRLAAKDIRPST